MPPPEFPPGERRAAATGNAVLEAEAAAWRDLAMGEYDRTVCALVESLTLNDTAILPLASAILRRNGPTLTASRACCAEHLVAFAATAAEPWRARSRWLFLMAWLRLGAVVAQGPETIATIP